MITAVAALGACGTLDVKGTLAMPCHLYTLVADRCFSFPIREVKCRRDGWISSRAPIKLRTSFTRCDSGISFMGNEDVAGSSGVGLLDENGLPVFPTKRL